MKTILIEDIGRWPLLVTYRRIQIYDPASKVDEQETRNLGWSTTYDC